MAKVLIVYATRSGETGEIAKLIAEGVRFSGAEADTVNVTDIKKESDLEGYDGYAFGSATYHGDMMQSMKTMLFLAEKADLEGKAGGSFGAFARPVEAVRTTQPLNSSTTYKVSKIESKSESGTSKTVLCGGRGSSRIYSGMR